MADVSQCGSAARLGLGVRSSCLRKLRLLGPVRATTRGKTRVKRKPDMTELLTFISVHPKRTPDISELVQHSRLTVNGDANLSTTMAELNRVALSTAQGWVALLPLRQYGEV